MRSAFWLESLSDLDEEPRRPRPAADWRPGFALAAPAAADSRGFFLYACDKKENRCSPVENARLSVAMKEKEPRNRRSL